MHFIFTEFELKWPKNKRVYNFVKELFLFHKYSLKHRKQKMFLCYCFYKCYITGLGGGGGGGGGGGSARADFQCL